MTDQQQVPKPRRTFQDVNQDFQVSLQKATEIIKILNGLVKESERLYQREEKKYQRLESKKSNRNRKQTGFIQERPISDQLADFLHEIDETIQHGSKLNCPQVAKLISQYCKTRNLTNGQILLYQDDESLHQIITPPKDEKPLTYLNLQTSIKHHFGHVSRLSKNRGDAPTSGSELPR